MDVNRVYSNMLLYTKNKYVSILRYKIYLAGVVDSKRS